MKILITGGLGTIGRLLNYFLLKKNHDVFYLDLSHNNDKNYYRCDISKYSQISEILNKHDFDIVYHTGAEFGRWNGEDFYENVWMSNAIGTKNIIRLQEIHKFKLIFFSSSEVYGDYEGIMSEDVLEKYPIKQMNDYAISKWSNEMQINNSILQFNTETVILRLFNTYGPGEIYNNYRSVVARFVNNCLNNEDLIVYKGHKRTSTYIMDLINVCLKIPDNFKSGQTYNIAGDDVHTTEELANIVIKNCGDTKSKIIIKDSEIMTTRDKVTTNLKIKTDFNFKQSVDIDQGVLNTYNWMKSYYNYNLKLTEIPFL